MVMRFCFICQGFLRNPSDISAAISIWNGILFVMATALKNVIKKNNNTCDKYEILVFKCI